MGNLLLCWLCVTIILISASPIRDAGLPFWEWDYPANLFNLANLQVDYIQSSGGAGELTAVNLSVTPEELKMFLDMELSGDRLTGFIDSRCGIRNCLEDPISLDMSSSRSRLLRLHVPHIHTWTLSFVGSYEPMCRRELIVQIFDRFFQHKGIGHRVYSRTSSQIHTIDSKGNVTLIGSISMILEPPYRVGK